MASSGHQGDEPVQPETATTSPVLPNQDELNRIDTLLQKSIARDEATHSPTSSSSSDSGYDPEGYWHEDQIALNVILNARNEYTLMPSTWKFSFKGIPLPEGLFYRKTKDIATRPRIYPHNERAEYRGTQALRNLMDVHGRIADLRDKQVEIATDYGKTSDQRESAIQAVAGDITKHIYRRLQDALKWSAVDGNLHMYGRQLPSNLKVYNLTPLSRRHDMREVIDKQMAAIAVDWKNTLSKLPGFDDVDEDERPKAPVVFGFFIYKHILFIVTSNASDPEATAHISIQLNMGEKNQHQWNSLAIMLTICWARDILMKKAAEMKLQPVRPKTSSDPDA